MSRPSTRGVLVRDDSAVTGTPKAFHDWNLDELGNLREHREEEAASFWTPELDQVNAYTRWDASFDRDGDGQEELLTLVRDHDEARAFLYRKEESDGSFTRYLHDALGRLVEVQRETGTGPETVVRYGYDTAGRLAWREEAAGNGKVWLVHDGANTVVEIAEETLGRRDIWTNVWSGSALVRAKQYLVRVFAHEGAHALGRLFTPHEDFPPGIWMGVD